MLFDDQPVEPTLGENVGGLAEAFPFTNNATRSASSIVVYVAAGNEATTLVAGLYADRSGHPGRRFVKAGRKLGHPRRSKSRPLEG